ncbi:N-acetylmannosamine-6-phosphate 2-epimerase [Mesotoga sp. H07.pep.5.3]|uniref:N-acetylmannosamine-6-phosphate 2-epimerase n=1 Tax=Mesotoga sp. H07.pep.5.3 TaxID=1421003 RepID=UPI000C4C2029|nr:N-acetylmannosamine-6-phosphate 2-epimerase [Mesotoga sp. H07.pep.5.3]PIJ62997.1 N-acetylmannosamine-6-phosphate 2-epimerase [Mesotoga sp. H07.pep.5.3]
MSEKKSMILSLYRKLIVSCQALEGEPLFGTEAIIQIAKAVAEGGASAIRANGFSDIMAIKALVNLPIIGLNKRHIEGYPVFITPTYEDASRVIEAGAEIVALDCTDRRRPESLKSIFDRIRSNYPQIAIMADIASLDDARQIIDLEPDILATTLSGYTADTNHRDKPDLELVEYLVKEFNVPVNAEGNFWTPDQVVNALKAGAHTVTVGSAITRPQIITERFVNNIIREFKSFG